MPKRPIDFEEDLNKFLRKNQLPVPKQRRVHLPAAPPILMANYDKKANEDEEQKIDTIMRKGRTPASDTCSKRAARIFLTKTMLVARDCIPDAVLSAVGKALQCLFEWFFNS